MANVISELRKKRNTGTVAKDRSSSDSSKITELRKKRREPELKKVEPFVKFDSSTRYDYDGKPSALKKFNPGTEMKKSIESSPVTNWERGNVTGAKTPSKDIIGNYLKQQGSKPLTDYQLKYGLDTPPKPQYREDGSRQINPEMLDMYFGPEVARPYYKEQAEYTNRELEEIASKHPVLSSMASVVTNLAKPGDAVQLINAKLRGEELDPNNTRFFGMTNTQNALRQGVTKDMGNVGSFLYSTGMSIVDSLVASATGSPTAGALLLAGSAGLDATQDAKERGATDSQAIWTGLASGTAEALFERVSLGNFKSLSEVPIKSIQDVAKNTVKSVFVNASEEAATELSNTITDYLIMQDLSNYELAYENYINTGMDEKSAKKQAWLDMAKQIGLSALGGALSGGVMGGVGQGVNYARTSNIGSQIDTEVDTMVDKAKSVEGTDLYQLALEVEKRKQAGKDATNYQKARLAYETQGIKAPVSSLQSDRTDETVQATETLTQETKPPKIEKESVKSADVTWGNVEGAKVKGIATVENNEVKVNIESNGQTVVDRIDNVIFENPAVKEIYDMAEQYKTNGAKSFVSNYQDSLDIESYKKGFDAYYDAGLVDLPMDKVNSAQGSLLGENVRYAAYVSGQNDGKVLTPKAVAPDFAGVVENDAMAKMDTNTREGLDALGKAVGVKIQIEESLAGGQANGLYKDGTLYIALDSDNPYMVVAKHELTHSIQQTSPDVYKRYKDFVISEINKSNPKAYNDMVDRLISRYSEIGETLTRDQAQDEIVADATEMFFTDSDIISRLANEDKNLAEKIVEFIKELISKIQNALQGAEPRSRAAIVLNENLETAKKAEKLWAEALIGKENIEETGDKGYNEIKDMLLENHEEYKTNKEALKYATEAIKDLGKIRYSLSDAGREVDRAGSGIRTIADGITRDFIQKGYVDLKGRKINSPADLAEIAQVFRDPRFETFRMFYVKNNKIVAHEGVTSRAPGLAVTFMDIPKRSDFKNDSDFRDAAREFQTTKFDDMKDRMKRLKADGYYILHNHPSGDPVPSHEDILATRGFINGMDGYKGHVIINSNKYCAVDINKLPQDNPIYNLSQQRLDFLLQPSKQHALLGEKINSADTLSAVAKAIQLNKDMSVIIYASSKGAIRGVQEVPNGFVMNDEFKGYIKNQSVEFGSGQTFLHTDSQDVFDRSTDLLSQKYITDGVITDKNGYTTSLREQGNRQNSGFEWAGMKTGEVSGYRVNEQQPSLNNIYYQLKDVDPVAYKDAIKENIKLKEINALLREQFYLTKEITPDKKQLNKKAKEILKMADSSYPVDSLVHNLENIWKFVREHTEENGEQFYTDEAIQATQSMAAMILRKSSVTDTSLLENSKDMLNYIKKTPIMISAKDRGDLASEGGIVKFRRKYIGKIRIVNENGIPVDSFYKELIELYPEHFSEDVTHPADQLIKIADIIDFIKPINYNPYGMDIDEAARDLAYEIISSSYFDISEAPPTFADKKKFELEKLKTKYNQRVREVRNEYKIKYNDRLQEIRKENAKKISDLKDKAKTATAEEKQAYNDKIARLKDNNLQKLQAQQDRFEERMQMGRARREQRVEVSKYKTRIKKLTKDLSNMLLKPDDKKHIPAGLKGSILQVCKLLDFETGITGPQGEPTQVSEKLRALQTQYTKLANETDDDISSFYDEDMSIALDELAGATQGRRINQLTSDELQQVYNIMKHIRHIVALENKMFSETIKESVAFAGEDQIMHLSNSSEFKQMDVVYKNKALKAFSDLLGKGNLKPYYFFKKLGGNLQTLYKGIRDGEDSFVRNFEKGKGYAKDAIDKYDYFSWAKDDKPQEFKTIKGDTISLTIGEKLYIYMAYQREQGKGHILNGGIVPSSQVSKKGKTSEQSKPIQFTERDITSLTNSLTDEQIGFAKEMGEYLSDDLSKLGNEVSLKMYGYEKFTEKNYIPLTSDPNFLTSKAGATDDRRIKRAGFTKSLINRASNPVIAADFLEVWSKHLTDMSMYNAFVLPMTDFERVWNYRVKDKDGKVSSVKASIQKAYGRRANDYIKNILNDTNGGIKAPVGGELSNILLAKMKADAVMGNLSVAIQQPSAIARAMVIINPKYFIKTTFSKRNYSELLKYSPQAALKQYGYFDVNMGRNLTDLITQPDYEGLEKFKAFFTDKNARNEVFSWLPQKMDEVTWAHIWNAIKAEAKAETKLVEGTEQFYDHVSERFKEVIDRSQVMDSVFQRSEIMRSQNAFTKMATSFMAEPTVNYNMIFDAITEFKKSGKSASAYVTRSVASVVSAMVLNSLLKSIITAMRDKDEDKEYAEKYLDGFIKNLADDPLGMIPYVNSAFSIFQGYNANRPDMQLVQNLYYAWTKLDSDKYTIKEKALQVAQAIAPFFNVPLKNISRDAEALFRNASDILDKTGVTEALPEYDRLKIKYDINDLENSKGTSEYYNYLYSIRGTEEYNEIFKELIRSGRKASNINQAMSDRVRLELFNRRKDEEFTHPFIIEAVEAKERKDAKGYKAATDKLQKDYAPKDILSAINSLESERNKANSPTPDEFIEAYKTGDKAKWGPLFKKMRAAGWKQEDILALVK